MTGISSVRTDYNNQNNYYLHKNNNFYTPASFQEPQPQYNPEKTVLTAGLLQAFALFLHKASEWCGNKLMQGKEFTNA